ncbi:glutamate 5-kinase [Pediococcus argentinicus]|uniref:Glutamate 5-kinase n=1 Tax=Pediococcus argentinicus TaxID=480391 RepID=A0A0R2NPT4_9LACO|nr:glutamate 5-kinase [Pediococcus argentinicus]KRO25891.1 proB protein [Pediococcus argentinicus]NKZ21884.1 glutamate 5-kinase [Pediococcus argentinicus]GEP19054.1 glutamate 5-kinase [Pediococcus argentinicus]
MERNIKGNRIVIKIGTSSLINPDGSLNRDSIQKLSDVLCELKMQGKEVVLVSSGAIGVGMGRVGLKDRPTTISGQQAVAAVGQGELIGIYERFFAKYQISVAQLLLTRDVLLFPQSKKNVSNAFQELLQMNVIPIVNENDTVSVDELDHETKFGDNDQLSAIVAKVIDADLLIMLSDIDGFYSANPNEDENAKLFSKVSRVDHSLINAAGGKGTKFGTGGMVTKLKAAKRILDNNQQMILANGSDPDIIFDILKGQDIGTWFTNTESTEMEG